MARISPNEPCPCGSRRKIKKCCGPAHEGRPAATAEALMRSRYSAYALGRVDYILETTHPAGPHFERDRAAWRAEVQRFCDTVSFEGLEVTAAREEGDRGMVEFHARLRQGDQATTMSERSIFLREGGRWLYHSGVRLP